MNGRALLLAAASVVGTASATGAQQQEPLPRAVFDVRAASVGLPIGEGWIPPVPQDTSVPGRTLGVDIGGHFYLWRGRIFALGVGASAVLARGSSTSPEPGAGAQGATPRPEVTTRLNTLAPQLSLNFGHGSGWSYISAGLGRARVESEVSRPLTPTSPTDVEIGWERTVNFGGGARWFINDHVAFTLDLRWHKLPSVPATATQAAAGKTSLIVAGGGISIK